MKYHKLFLFIWLCVYGVSICNADEFYFEFRIRELNYKVTMQSLQVKMALSKEDTQTKLEELDLKFRGRIPNELKQNGLRAEETLTKEKNAFQAIENEIKTLRTELIKYYKGKPPNKLSQEIDDLLSSYLQKSTEVNKTATEIYSK